MPLSFKFNKKAAELVEKAAKEITENKELQNKVAELVKNSREVDFNADSKPAEKVEAKPAEKVEAKPAEKKSWFGSKKSNRDIKVEEKKTEESKVVEKKSWFGSKKSNRDFNADTIVNTIVNVDDKKAEDPKAVDKKDEEPKAAVKKDEEPKAAVKKDEEPKAAVKKDEEPKAAEKKAEEPAKLGFSLFRKKEEEKKVVEEKDRVLEKIFNDLAANDGDDKPETICVKLMISNFDHRVIGLPVNAIFTLLNNKGKTYVAFDEFSIYYNLYKASQLEASNILVEKNVILHSDIAPHISNFEQKRMDEVLPLASLYRDCRHTKNSKFRINDPNNHDDKFNFSELVDFLTLYRIHERLM